MTQRRCEDYQADFVPLLGAELEPLNRERVQTHLAHCTDCQTVYAHLGLGLDTARAWRPELGVGHLERLTARLSPYVQSARPRNPWRLNLAVASAALATLLLTIGLVTLIGSRTREAPTTTDDSIAFDFINDWSPDTSLKRQAPSRFVRLVSNERWDGKIEGDARRLVVTMTQGFALFAFKGGHGRSLRVSSPGVKVEVVGTRFFVEAHTGSKPGTTIGVAEGRVRVTTSSKLVELGAGEQASFDARGERVAVVGAQAGIYLQERYLLSLDAALAEGSNRAHRARKTEKSAALSRSGKKARKAQKEPGIVEKLEWAEELAQLGEFRAAMAAYRAIAEDPRPVYAPYRDLSRYEMARIAGFNLGEVQSARVMLRDLKKRGRGEVRRQATLGLCELVLAARPCKAKACLQNLLEGHSADFEVTREAARLLEHWKLASLVCDPQEKP